MVDIEALIKHCRVLNRLVIYVFEKHSITKELLPALCLPAKL